MENLNKAILIRNGNVIGTMGDKYFSTAPLGTVLSFAGQATPNGYLLCNGASYLVKDYPDLYAVIGNIYGGDDTSFNVPNLVDKFIQGSTTSGTDKEAGLPQVNMTNAREVSAQNTTISAKEGLLQNGQSGYGASGSKSSLNATSMVGLNLNNNNALGVTVEDTLIANNPIYGNSDTVQPPALTMVYIIKAFHTNEGTDTGVSDDVVEYVAGELDKKAAIDDTQASTNTVWSSKKTSDEIAKQPLYCVYDRGLTGASTPSYFKLNNVLVTPAGQNCFIDLILLLVSRSGDKVYVNIGRSGGATPNEILININRDGNPSSKKIEKIYHNETDLYVSMGNYIDFFKVYLVAGTLNENFEVVHNYETLNTTNLVEIPIAENATKSDLGSNVALTNITFNSTYAIATSGGHGCTYIVRNGICYVNMDMRIVANGKICTLPKPLMSVINIPMTVFMHNVTGEVEAVNNGILMVNSDGSATTLGALTNESRYMMNFSYPIA